MFMNLNSKIYDMIKYNSKCAKKYNAIFNLKAYTKLYFQTENKFSTLKIAIIMKTKQQQINK